MEKLGTRELFLLLSLSLIKASRPEGNFVITLLFNGSLPLLSSTTGCNEFIDTGGFSTTMPSCNDDNNTEIAQNVIQFSIGLANASPLSASVSLNVKIQLHNSTISYNISAPISLENEGATENVSAMEYSSFADDTSPTKDILTTKSALLISTSTSSPIEKSGNIPLSMFITVVATLAILLIIVSFFLILNICILCHSRKKLKKYNLEKKKGEEWPIIVTTAPVRKKMPLEVPKKKDTEVSTKMETIPEMEGKEITGGVTDENLKSVQVAVSEIEERSGKKGVIVKGAAKGDRSWNLIARCKNISAHKTGKSKSKVGTISGGDGYVDVSPPLKDSAGYIHVVPLPVTKKRPQSEQIELQEHHLATPFLQGGRPQSMQVVVVESHNVDGDIEQNSDKNPPEAGSDNADDIQMQPNTIYGLNMIIVNPQTEAAPDYEYVLPSLR